MTGCKTMQTSIVIPARLKSSRFPEKILADLCGKPVLRHVYEGANMVPDINEVIILADAKTTIKQANEWGAKTIITPENCVSGTERIVFALDKIQGDFIINIQGDEPFVDIKLIGKIISAAKSSNSDIYTPIFKITNEKDLFNSNRVKVVKAQNNRALYFSRSAIPFVRDAEQSNWISKNDFFGHIGIYGYKRHVLENYKNLVDGKLEHTEQLEQLRMLENGYSIETILSERSTIGIDTKEDLANAINEYNKLMHKNY